jgi:hypothetical protein
MEARLSGTGFKIASITPERQAVSQIERTEWRWQVEPTRTGVLHLQLTLTANLDVAGRSVPRMIRTFEQRIAVEVAWTERTKAFLAGNWQWLWTAILIPLLAWGYRILQRFKYFARIERSGHPAPGAPGCAPLRRGAAGE